METKKKVNWEAWNYIFVGLVMTFASLYIALNATGIDLLIGIFAMPGMGLFALGIAQLNGFKPKGVRP